MTEFEDFRLKHIDKIVNINNVDFMSAKDSFELLTFYETQFKKISEQIAELTGFKPIRV